jgi:lipopolysaccharide/colanic/teichoic acid biosynthesis glycosyltransferase
MLRFLDVVLAAIGLVVAAPVMLIIMVLGYFDTAAPIFTQVRMGRHQQPFTLVKFRTMRHGTESVATHLVDPAVVTPFGSLLRRTKLDELPQLWNVLKGEMSMVGPRPCLFSQQELIQVRAARGVFQARPGITGLAQVQGIDMSEPELLADTDARMLESLGVAAYLGYIVKTLTGSGQGDWMRG